MESYVLKIISQLVDVSPATAILALVCFCQVVLIRHLLQMLEKKDAAIREMHQHIQANTGTLASHNTLLQALINRLITTTGGTP